MLRGGIYELVAVVYDDDGLTETKFTIDAVKAVNAIQAVECGEDFDCDASSKFETDVEVKAVVTKRLSAS